MDNTQDVSTGVQQSAKLEESSALGFNNPPQKAMVLLSGGIDSSTCLAIALRSLNQVQTVSINYGQRHKKEIDYASEISDYYQVPHYVVNIDQLIPKTMLTNEDTDVPNVSYDELQGISPTYVPFRNGLMLAALAARAQGANIPTVIYFGAHAEDAHNWAYPDCTPEFIGAMQQAIFVGTYGLVRLQAPLTYMNKKQIIQRGSEIGVPYHLTWSCYKGGELHCGTCPTCRARKAGFRQAGIFDPTEYAA